VFEGKTTGTPIAMIIPNEDQRSKDYSHNVPMYSAHRMPIILTKVNMVSAITAVAAAHQPAKPQPV
jgi:hypothetical protein